MGFFVTMDYWVDFNILTSYESYGQSWFFQQFPWADCFPWNYVCVSLRLSTMKASYVRGWNSRGQINDVVLKTFLSSAKSLHRYFIMKHRAFLASHFILFTH